MALCLLARDWAAARDGALTALTVDHGLRPEAADEARQVGRWLRVRHIRHVVLRRQGPRPRADIQAAARAARYDLLTGWCRANAVLHLLLAHHQEDQAETLLLRLARGSGVDGLAGMPAIAERDGVRLLRPLLTVPRDRLRATLQACRQDWIEDPSNLDPAYARVRMRALLPPLAREGLTAERLAATAGRLGEARAALESGVTDLLARAAALYPAGYVTLALAPLRAAPREIGMRALARCLMTVSGQDYTPRLDRLDRLHAVLLSSGRWPARTLAGCRIVCVGGHALICREAAQVAPPVAIAAGARIRWDRRFAVTVAEGAAVRRGTVVAGLGEEGWRQAVADDPGLRRHSVPPPVRPSLPAVWQGDRLLAVPHLAWRRRDARIGSVTIEFAPAHPLAPARFPAAVAEGALVPGCFTVA